jgi:hypothetical protein
VTTGYHPSGPAAGRGLDVPRHAGERLPHRPRRPGGG